MTRREAERLTHQQDTLTSLGFTREESEQLRRISMTLHRWYEYECNGNIQRDGENADGKPRWFPNPSDNPFSYGIPDRERGAVKRLDAILNRTNRERAKIGPHQALGYYLQTDPRGAVLYIIRPGDVPDGADVSSYYTRGICVY